MLALELVLGLELALERVLALELVASVLVLELVLVIVIVAFAAILGELDAPVALVPFASQLDCYALAAYPVALEFADPLARWR